MSSIRDAITKDFSFNRWFLFYTCTVLTTTKINNLQEGKKMNFHKIHRNGNYYNPCRT